MKTPPCSVTVRWWLCCCAGLLHAPATLADCVLEAPSTVALGRYDPLATQPAPVSWKLTVRPRNPQLGCQARLQAETTDMSGNLVLLGNDPAGLRLSLAQDAGGRQPMAVAPQDAAAFQLEPGQQTQLTLWALRGAGQWISPGLYRGSLRLNLLDEQGRTLDRRDIELQSIAPPIVQTQFGLSNAASGLNSTQLDFGELRQGARRSAALSLQSNTGYLITLTSTNNGKLVNSSYAQEQISYQLRLDGVPIALNQLVMGPAMSRPGRQRHDCRRQG